MNESVKVFAIYVHIPFCENKCPYCDFFSRTRKDKEVESFVSSIISEIRHSRFAGSRASTLFLGGGTPSILLPDQIKRIIESLEDSFCFSETPITENREPNTSREWTIECNPGTVNRDSIGYLIKQGFNRFSLGAQSFSDSLLRKLGRIHTVKDTLLSYSLLRNKGVSNISLDLIFGLPGQTLENWSDDLKSAVLLQPEHLSIYGLTIEPETEFGRLQEAGQLKLPGEEIEAQLYEMTLDYLSESGYEQYEISNFALPGYECRHNLVYWGDSEYLGFGPGAASYDGQSRWTNSSDWNRYLESARQGKVIHENEEKLVGAEKFAEELLILLRLNNGFDIQSLLMKHELGDFPSLKNAIHELERQSLLEKTGTSRLRLTTRGKLLASEVSVRLMLAIEN